MSSERSVWLSASTGALTSTNVAGFNGDLAPLAELSEENFDAVLHTNTKGVFLCMKHEIAAMLRTGGGAIVNVSSISGLVGFPGLSTYAASKHAVHGMSKAAALDYAKRGIRVNVVAPGGVDTELLDSYVVKLRRDFGIENPREAMMNDHPMGRIADPDEIAAAILFLCSPASAFTTGQVLAVDGGATSD